MKLFSRRPLEKQYPRLSARSAVIKTLVAAVDRARTLATFCSHSTKKHGAMASAAKTARSSAGTPHPAARQGRVGCVERWPNDLPPCRQATSGLAGESTSRRRALVRLFAKWAPLTIAIFLVGLASGRVESWVFMWLICGAIYAGLKWAAWSASCLPMGVSCTGVALRYFACWPGMRPAELARPVLSMNRPTIEEWIAVAAKTLLGAGIFVAAVALIDRSINVVVAWLAMIGFVVTLHFGVFHLLALLWRAGGYRVTRVMDRPLAAGSLSDFWSNRWNRAFRDAAHLLVFRPVARRWGAPTATMATFGFSGLIHDLAISWPAGGGWGLPTIYFLIQGTAVLAERRAGGLWAHGPPTWLAKTFTLLVLTAPLGLLVHQPFVQEVILPMLRYLAFV